MTLQEFIPPRRLLLGPGPSLVHPRVLRALSTPLLGHLDPVFLTVMNDIQSSLRMIFETEHRFTIAISGTGSAGMEASIVNLVEPGDAVIVGINGIFGTRLASVVDRCGGKAIRVEAPWGECIQPDAIEHALVRSGPVKAVAIVHAETSPAPGNRSKTSAPCVDDMMRCSWSMPSPHSVDSRSASIVSASTSVTAAPRNA